MRRVRRWVWVQLGRWRLQALVLVPVPVPVPVPVWGLVRGVAQVQVVGLAPVLALELE